MHLPFQRSWKDYLCHKDLTSLCFVCLCVWEGEKSEQANYQPGDSNSMEEMECWGHC